MPFEPNNNANPTGSNGRKLLIDAVHTLVTAEWPNDEPPAPPRNAIGLHKMAYKIVSGVMNEKFKPSERLTYWQEICDRLYGKPKQALTGGDGDDTPLRVIIEKPHA